MRRKNFLIPFLIFLFFYSFLSAQESNGPASGSSNTGVLTSTYTIPAMSPAELSAEVKMTPLRYPVNDDVIMKLKNQLLAPQTNGAGCEVDNAILQSEPAAPPLISDFEGITYTNWIPPDPVLAVGPDHIVMVVNSSWAIYDKTGTQLFLTTLDAWFSVVSPPGSAFDPKVIYDHHAGRWVILALAVNATSSSYLISVSDDDDPGGSWWSWNLDAAADGATPTNNGADFPGLGFDENSAVYISSNQYDDYLNGSFEYAKLRILYKSQLYWEGSGGALSWWDFWNFTNADASTAFTLKPAHTFGTPGVEYFVNTHSGGGNSVTLWALTNPLGTPPTMTRQATVSIGTYAVPPNAAQPGVTISTDYIHTGDCRTQDVQFRNGHLYTAFTVGYNWGSGTVSAIRYLKINTSTNTTAINVTYGADGAFYYYPTMYTDQTDNIFLVFNRSASTEYAGIRYSGRKTSDTTTQPSAQLKGGEGFYKRLDSINRNRWGDYSGIGVDPSDGTTVWICGEYARNDNTWSTWIGALREGVLDYLTVAPPNRDVSSDAGQTTFDVTSNISWTVSESESWLSVTPITGSGDGTLTVNYDQNTSVNDRIGTITVSGSGIMREVQVTQQGITTSVLYQGPDSCFIGGGAFANTDDSLMAAPVIQDQNKIAPLRQIPLVQDTEYLPSPAAQAGSNFIRDMSTQVPVLREPETDQPDLLVGFEGIPDAQDAFGYMHIPPDPIMAAGPDHIIGCVNSNFAIFDKSGTMLKQIDGTLWFENVLPGLGAGEPFGFVYDPQIVYDPQANRWVMLYIADNNANESYLLISTSDDADPLGTWCNFAIPGNQNGCQITSNMNDYPKLGIDDQAIYVTANMFDLGTLLFQYVQVRILEKTQFYNNTCGEITWTDFWDLRDPDNLSVKVFTTVPAVHYPGPSGSAYLINDSPYVTGTFMTLWSLNDPLGTPTLSAVNIPITTSNGAPSNAEQLDGGTPLIDVGGRRVRNAVYRDGSVWTAHSVPGGTGNAFSFARYVRVDVSTLNAIEDVAFGADDYWYYYPAVTTDYNGNLYMVFNRSGYSEYAGIRYTGRLTSDPPGLQPSALLKAGEDNYVKTFGGSRNRWGDYNGIALDPAGDTKVWVFAEYAAESVGPGINDDRWGTWFGQVSFTLTQTAPITFEADLTNFIAAGWFNPSDPSDSIVVNGSFNGWNSQEKMTPDSGDPNIYKYTVNVTMNPGEFIEWKFRLFPEDNWQNGGWEWGDNRLTEFTGEEIVLDPIEPNVSPMQHFNPVEPTGRIQPVYIVDVTLDDVQLQPGDEVAVLDGDLIVGAAAIEELPMVNPISVYLTYTPPGGDPLPGAQDGNDMLFRVWDQSEDREECAKISEVVTGTPIFGEGSIVAVRLEAPCEITQSIGIRPAFLNLISFNLHPVDPSAVAVFDPIFEWLVIVQDHEGLVYIPPDIVFPGHPGSNTIDANTGIKVEKGYNVFINSGEEQTLEVTGLAVNLNEIPISVLPQFLNKISFPSQQVMLIQDVFSGIVNQHIYNDLSIVQDHDGYVYIPPNIVFPGHPGSNTVDANGGMQPGKGYMLYHRNSGELSFTYPVAAGAVSLAKARGEIEKELPQHYTCTKTGEPHALFMKNINVNLKEGDELGVFADGLCVGSKRYVDNLNDPLIIWRALPDYDLKGIKDGDNVEIRLWKGKSETIEVLQLDGDIVFSRERVLSLVKISSGMKVDGLNLVSDMIPTEMGLHQNYPNPFNPTTTIEISLNKDTDVSLIIYNIRGEVVRRLVSGRYSAGRYQVEWDGRNEHGLQVATSIYIYRLQAGSFVENRKMIISK